MSQFATTRWSLILDARGAPEDARPALEEICRAYRGPVLSYVRRAGHAGWLRNIAVALGNAPTSAEVVVALESRRGHDSALVREHVAWALQRHGVA